MGLREGAAGFARVVGTSLLVKVASRFFIQDRIFAMYCLYAHPSKLNCFWHYFSHFLALKRILLALNPTFCVFRSFYLFEFNLDFSDNFGNQQAFCQ